MSKPEEAGEFLRRFFENTSHAVELRALPSTDRIFTRRLGSARNFVKAHENENLYFGCATREGGGEKKHCVEIPALWLDMDFKAIPEDEAWELIRQFPISPSVIVASGGGLHVYWLLAQPVSAHDASVESILRVLAKALGGDRAVAEIAQIMRLPGTLNRKYTPPRACRVLEADWARRYTLADFEKFREGPCGHADTDCNATSKIREGHRNSSLMSIAGGLRQRGMDEATVTVVLLAVNRERCEPVLPEGEVRRVAKSASRYPPRANDSLHSPWDEAVSIKKFMGSGDPEFDFFDDE
jgi:hypothetical protein